MTHRCISVMLECPDFCSHLSAKVTHSTWYFSPHYLFVIISLMINRNIINGVSIDGVSNAAGAVKHREILLNQTEIRLYFPFSDWFGKSNGQWPFSVPNQSENGKYNLISVDLIRFRKDFSVCSIEGQLSLKVKGFKAWAGTFPSWRLYL